MDEERLGRSLFLLQLLYRLTTLMKADSVETAATKTKPVLVHAGGLPYGKPLRVYVPEAATLVARLLFIKIDNVFITRESCENFTHSLHLTTKET
ncbi:hypothetical protein [Gloeocapsa sp. PCC 7428]|uniref:hypothetical protein n=1 Tax=Gloeocapsa sp. PCC 7428 TaxID=1173026 RepID=UPI0012DC29E8|nr:hypothetical protein [Gloeocapsa sp. PCC 7428]